MALWSGRFEQNPDKAVADYSQSISFDHKLYKYDIEGSIAHAKMLSHQKIISKAQCDNIISGLAKIAKSIDSGNFEFRTDLEDIHMHIESALIVEIGDDGARLHTARSRNDQIALDIRLYLRDNIKLIIDKITFLQKALLETSKANLKIIIPGYTHMQRAQPVLFAHHLLAYIEMFSRDKSRLRDCFRRLNVMPLGSGALAGTTLPINREYTAELLDFPEVSRNSMDAVSDRDFACEFLSNLAIFGMHISRLSEDIILWSTSEFKFIEISDDFCTGSSLMPQKKNPDIAELSRGKTGRLYGNMISLFTVLKGLPLSYNRDLQEDKEPIFDAIETVLKILSVYPPMIMKIKVNPGKALEAASDPTLMATDLAERLVQLGLPFRTSHHRVGELVKFCNDNNISMNKLSFEQLKSVIPEADTECLNLFSPESSINKRNLTGGTSFHQVGLQINFWESQIS
ncbi:MAG TPA: argininosuccinate lyase [Lentisphaeria bacterium]|nr:MAG: argininosuccinate lyase [Lentisphaerae bacterium GWF2_38_69]HBM17575.1 argininosuccinate lyase [Lentisphaeria bacterium]